MYDVSVYLVGWYGTIKNTYNSYSKQCRTRNIACNK